MARRLGYFLFACVCICVSGAWGESSRSLRIIVADPAGDTVPDAKVILFTDDAVVIAKIQSGDYLFSPVPPHSHELEVSSPGFKPVRIPITNDTPEQITVTLQIGEGSGPYRVCDIRGREFELPPPLLQRHTLSEWIERI